MNREYKKNSTKRRQSKETLFRPFCICVFFLSFLFFCPKNVFSYPFEDYLSLSRLLDYTSFSYKGFDVHVMELSISESYDDNISYDEDGEEDEDFITNYGFGFGLRYESETKYLDLWTRITVQDFQRNEEFDNTAEEVFFSFKNEFSKYDRLNITNVYSHSESPTEQSTFFEGVFEHEFEREESETIRDTGRLEYFNNRLRINYTKDISKHLNGILRLKNDADAFTDIDIPASFLVAAEADVNYLYNPNTTFFATYEFAKRIRDDGGNARMHTFFVGMIRYLTRKIFVDANAGLDFIDTYQNENTTRSLFKTSINYQKDTLTNIQLSLEKNNHMSRFAETIQSRRIAKFNFTRSITERLQGSLSLFFAEGAGLARPKRRLKGVDTVFTYDINEFVIADFSYSFSDNSSSVDASEYTKNMVLLGITANF